MTFIAFIAFIWQTYKAYVLGQIDFSKKITNNIYNTNRFNILIKREKLSSIVIAFPISLLCILAYAEVKVGIYSWLFLLCIAILTIFYCLWSYKKIYDKNINSILDSLNEIKDLNKEE